MRGNKLASAAEKAGRGVRLFSVLAIVASVVASSASAYIDPGTGSMFFQVLLAGFIGLTVMAKMYWLRLKTFFAGLFRGKDNGKK